MIFGLSLIGVYFTWTISKTDLYALTMFSMIHCNFIVHYIHSISFDPIDLE